MFDNPHCSSHSSEQDLRFGSSASAHTACHGAPGLRQGTGHYIDWPKQTGKLAWLFALRSHPVALAGIQTVIDIIWPPRMSNAPIKQRNRGSHLDRLV
jgi:hypothetical protein